MSLFDPKAKPATPQSQTPVTTTTEDDPVNALVGEGKKFKDVQSLAKGKLDSDKHISNLEGELAGLRQELEQRISLEQFLDRLEQGSEPKKPEATTPQAQVSQPISQEDIANTVKQILSTEKDTSTRQSNISYVRSELEKAWGDEFNTKLTQAAQELGGKEFIDSLAQTNPKALLKLVGISQVQQTTTPVDTKTFTPPRTTQVSSFGSNQPTKNSMEYYREMRKKDPKKYWSAENQMAMHKVAQEMGESFFS